MLTLVLTLIILLSILPLAYGSSLVEQIKASDPCKDHPPGAGYEKSWTCGEWKVDHGQIRRVFNLYVSEHTEQNIGNDDVETWTFNGTAPGPTLRMVEGDLVTIYVHNKDDPELSHSLHMHSIHQSSFDGSGHNRTAHEIPPDTSGQYVFTAMPAGLYPYHCHIDPVPLHISKGLYGMMIIDPKEPRAPANEIFLMMSAFDTDDDQVNDVYTYNGKSMQYSETPIHANVGELVRIYIVNMVEYRDTLSFHIHGQMFNYWASGTPQSAMIYTDIVTLSQGDRGIIEFRSPYANTFMIHPHNNDAADDGMMGFIDFR